MEGHDGKTLRPFVSIFSRWLPHAAHSHTRLEYPRIVPDKLGASLAASGRRSPLHELDTRFTAPNLPLQDPVQIKTMSEAVDFPTDQPSVQSRCSQTSVPHSDEPSTHVPASASPEPQHDQPVSLALLDEPADENAPMSLSTQDTAPMESTRFSRPEGSRGVKRRRPAYLDKPRPPKTRSTFQLLPQHVDRGIESLAVDAPPKTQPDPVTLKPADQVNEVQHVGLGQPGSSPLESAAPDLDGHRSSSDIDRDPVIDQSERLSVDDLPRLPSATGQRARVYETEDAVTKSPGVTSSLSILSNTPDLSQTPAPPSSDQHTPRLTSYIVDSDEGNVSDGSGIALEEDVAAPKHEPRVERSQTSFDSDSDTSLIDFEALKRGSRSSRMGPAKRVSATPRAPVKKPTWSSSTMEELVRQNEKDTKRTLEIEEARRVLNTAVAGDVASTDQAEDQFFSALVNNSDDASALDKMRQAIDRTDMMIEDVFWQFMSTSTPGQDHKPFPTSLPEAYDWMQDTGFREQAFLSGFAPKVLRAADLPQELRMWIWDEYFTTQRDESALAYLDCLEACMSDAATSRRLEKTLRQMGARPEVFDRDHTIVPDSRGQPPLKETSKALKRFVALIWRFSDVIPVETAKLSVEVLLRLSLDSGLIASSGIRGELQRCLHDLLLRLFGMQAQEWSATDISSTLVQTIKHPVLQWKLVSVLPSTSAETHGFARRLALSFFLDSAGYLTFPLNGADTLIDRITKKLQHDSSATKESRTDFASLAASINILDVAIGNGFARPSPAAPKQDRKAFDARIDRLSRALAQLSARIIDTGASHLQRTEAKGAVGRLMARLEHAVRTVPKPVSHVLDDARWSAASRGKGAGAPRAAMLPGRRRTLDTWVQATGPSDTGNASKPHVEHTTPDAHGAEAAPEAAIPRASPEAEARETETVAASAP